MNDEDQYFESLHGEGRLIAIELRKLIRAVSADFVEQIKWNVPTYSINKMVCSIMPHKRHVNLQIFRGAELKDANKLQGTGKNMRHMKFSNLSDIDVSTVKNILKQAVTVDTQ